MPVNSTVLSKALTSSTTSRDDYENLNRPMNADVHDDSVRVEIRELENSYANSTTVSLMRCKKQVLHPFRNLLCLIGWRPFGLDSVKRSSLALRILNVIYPLIVFALLLFNYVYEILVCQGKLDTDEGTETTTTTRYPRLIDDTNTTMMYRHVHKDDHQKWNNTQCGHIVTIYIIPDILHCAAFMIGFIYFRATEGEQMYSLMEKVFIHADRNMPLFSPNRIIRRLKIFLIIACCWVLASVTVHALSVVITDFEHHGVIHYLSASEGKWIQYVLFVIDLFCLLMKNCVHIAVAINFVGHCEMVVFYCKGIRTRLEEKSIPLVEAMKQILDVRVAISQLNGAVSRMMSLLVVYFLDRIVLGIILFVQVKVPNPLVYVYRGLYPLIWLSILVFCLSLAARVTSKCDKFHRIGHSMRVYGYHSASLSELDGFLIFISSAELRAKLLGLTIRPGNVILMVVIVMISCVILIQTELIKSSAIPL